LPAASSAVESFLGPADQSAERAVTPRAFTAAPRPPLHPR
jgi:hypothetical protein